MNIIRFSSEKQSFEAVYEEWYDRVYNYAYIYSIGTPLSHKRAEKPYE